MPFPRPAAAITSRVRVAEESSGSAMSSKRAEAGPMWTILETVGLLALLGGAVWYFTRLQHRPACAPGKASCGCNSCPLQSQCGLISIEPGPAPAEEEHHDPPRPPDHRPEGVR